MNSPSPYPDIASKFVETGLTYKFDADVIHAHLVVEMLITRALELHLPYPDDLELDRLLFSQKANLVFAMGLLHQRFKGIIRLLNAHRRSHAHTLDFEMTEGIATEFEQTMKSCGIKWTDKDMQLLFLSLMTKDKPPARVKFQDLGRVLAIDVCRELTEQYDVLKPAPKPPVGKS
jgi:hypothetical protein